MKTVTEQIRARLHARLGIHEVNGRLDARMIVHSEWCPEFECLQRARLIMGACRYGPLGAANKPAWDRPPDIKRRIEAYEGDGDLEHLVDVANLCMLEYVEGRHPLRHLGGRDDGAHTQVKK